MLSLDGEGAGEDSRVTRIAVIGHVEWVLQARSREPLERGAIVQLDDTFDEPGGGGGVAARALPALGAETRFFTALGNDAAARASRARAARATAATLRVARRAGPAEPRDHDLRSRRRAHDLRARRRTRIPTLDDPLDWDELAGFDGVFYTGDDPRTVVAARRARVLVVTARRLASVIESGVQVDVLVGSAQRPRRALRRRRSARAPAARASGPRAPTAAATSPTTAARAAGRPSRRPARSSTPTARATCSWRR